MLSDIKRLPLLNENFLTDFRVLHHSLLVELSSAVVARYKSAYFSVLIRLVCVSKPRSGISRRLKVSDPLSWVLAHHLNWWLLLASR